jgi:hypothetical protein
MGNLFTYENGNRTCCAEPHIRKPRDSAALSEEEAEYLDAVLLNIETQSLYQVNMTSR